MDVDEGSIRRLQRTAYGAEATDAERARAVEALAALALQGGDRDAAHSTKPADPDGGAGAAETADAASEPTTARSAPNGAGRARLVRWTIAAGAVGLLVGGAVGWAAGQRAPADLALSSTASPSTSAEPATPLEDSGLLRVFDRRPLAAESTRVATLYDEIDPDSVRLLATRVDGTAAYLARTVDGENVCLVLLLPAGTPRLECTVDGLVPADGLSIRYGAEGYGLSEANLDPTGTVSLGLLGQ